ncbi:MAG: signal peptide peptidase SppA [Bacteroidota bacterium]|nr:signal peptide peptidase SppA [Bacteroidota bacterium]
MFRTKTVFLLNLAAITFLFAQPAIHSSYYQNDFSMTSPGAMKYGLYGFDNPALLNYLDSPDLLVTWSNPPSFLGNINRFGFFGALPHFGFGVVKQRGPIFYATDYRISLSSGNRAASMGLTYGWTNSDDPFKDYSNILRIGALFRPNVYASVGLIGTAALRGNDKEGVVDVAARPFGNELLALFADFSMETKRLPSTPKWSAGGAVELLPGVRVTARYFDTKVLSLGLQFSLGTIGVESQAEYDGSGSYSYNTYGVRIGAYDRNIVQSFLFRKKEYLDLNLYGPVKYRRYVLFDNSKTLLNLLDAVDAAKNDPAVSGIAINASGMDANREMLWELREKLKEFEATGKHVIIFIDRGGIDEYHFASVADKIVMDPSGMLMLQGFMMGRMYLKGSLEKLGIGFDEWRFFKYKSADETFSRDKMSDADREQRQKLVDDDYRLAKDDICASRHFSSAQFDSLVNDKTLFLPNDACTSGLVDTVGRWDVVEKMVKGMEREHQFMVSPFMLAKNHLPSDNRWGEPPRIAVIYALGACAMDEGITARRLVKDVNAAVNDPRVKGIVLRVDSPGGDAMASDYIAEALKKAKGKKPVIVSQGYVAASGGYWLSMYGDTIVAAPNTITGSIGVIGGWLYNKSAKESLGISTDFVKAGEHADLGFGMTMPFFGLTLPDRNLTEDERGKMEHSIKALYKDFVQKVADGRKKSVDTIEAIAQGRVWSGYDGEANGLVDVLGGLSDAIAIAKTKAGIAKDEDVKIVEYPAMGLFNFDAFAPRLFGIDVKKDAAVEYLKFRFEHNGEPLPMLPMEYLDVKPAE